MATTDFLLWGDGKGDVKEWNFRAKEVKPIKEFTTRLTINKVYIKDDAILYIVNGSLHKEGYFNFEKFEKSENNKFSQESPPKKEVFLKEGITDVQVAIADIVFGENHVLILGVNRRIYAWGDNYYGQLGLGNLMIPWTLEPQYVKLNFEVKKIFAYKNNSYAIDINDKLWVWGKNELLGKNYRNNIFRPSMILAQYKVQDLILQDNRAIVMANLQSEIKDKKAKNDEETKKEETKGGEEDRDDEDNKSKSSSRYDTKNPDKNNKGKPGERNKNKIETKKVDGTNYSGINRYIESLDNAFKAIISYSESKNEKLSTLRKMVLRDSNSIKEIGLENYWDKICNLIEEQKTKANSKSGGKDITLGKQIEIFIACLNSILCGKFDNSTRDDTMKYIKEFPKEVLKLVLDNVGEQSDKNILLADPNVMSFNENVKLVLGYLFKYKKIEVLVHRMSSLSFLLRSFKFSNMLEGIKAIQDRDDNVERKLFLVEKAFAPIELLLEKVKGQFVTLQETFEVLEKLSPDSEVDSEKFIYKFIIENVSHLLELWYQLSKSIKSEHECQTKITQIIFVIEKFKEIYAIYSYLSQTNLKNIIYEINNKNDMKYIDLERLKEKIALAMTQIDGAIIKLEKLLGKKDEFEDKEAKNEDVFSRQIILMMGTTVLDNAFLRKLVYSLIYSIVEEKSNNNINLSKATPR